MMRRRLFAVRNERSKGIAVEKELGGYHSGGLVVIAESLEEAQEMFIKSLEKNSRPDDVVDFGYMAELLEEFPLYISAGVVLFANGEC